MKLFLRHPSALIIGAIALVFLDKKGSRSNVVRLFPDSEFWKYQAYQKFDDAFGLNFNEWVKLLKQHDRIAQQNKGQAGFKRATFGSYEPRYKTLPFQTVVISRYDVERWAKDNGYIFEGYDLRKE